MTRWTGHNLADLRIALPAMAVGVALVGPSALALLAAGVHPRWWSTAMGFAFALIDLAGLLANPAMAVAQDRFGLAGPAVVGLGAAGISLLLALLLVATRLACLPAMPPRPAPEPGAPCA